MKKLVFPFGIESYLNKSKSWGEEVRKEIEQVECILQHSEFAYFACGNQEVYEVKEEALFLYEDLKNKLKSWIVSKDKIKYQMARQVTTW